MTESVPNIFFTQPTPANNSVISTNYVEINLSIAEQNLDTFKFNWNGTNYSFYDYSLALAFNFNNNSAIGESAAKAVDISRYRSNGTINGPTLTTGKFGYALQFNGINGYIDAGNASSLNIGDEITIEAWVLARASNSNQMK